MTKLYFRSTPVRLLLRVKIISLLQYRHAVFLLLVFLQKKGYEMYKRREGFQESLYHYSYIFQQDEFGSGTRLSIRTAFWKRMVVLEAKVETSCSSCGFDGFIETYFQGHHVSSNQVDFLTCLEHLSGFNYFFKYRI